MIQSQLERVRKVIAESVGLTHGDLSRKPAVLSPSVKVASAPITGAIVDVEVYDSADREVFQKYYLGQDFTVGQTRSYPTKGLSVYKGCI